MVGVGLDAERGSDASEAVRWGGCGATEAVALPWGLGLAWRRGGSESASGAHRMSLSTGVDTLFGKLELERVVGLHRCSTAPLPAPGRPIGLASRGCAPLPGDVPLRTSGTGSRRRP